MSDILSLHITSEKLDSCLKRSDYNGRKVYKLNSHYRNISELLDNQSFRKIFDKYTSTDIDIKTLFLFMKLYVEIEKAANNKNIRLNKFQKISILDSVMKNRNFRQDICHNFGKLYITKKIKKSISSPSLTSKR
jgi:hypothetical protein